MAIYPPRGVPRGIYIYIYIYKKPSEMILKETEMDTYNTFDCFYITLNYNSFSWFWKTMENPRGICTFSRSQFSRIPCAGIESYSDFSKLVLHDSPENWHYQNHWNSSRKQMIRESWFLSFFVTTSIFSDSSIPSWEASNSSRNGPLFEPARNFKKKNITKFV